MFRWLMMGKSIDEIVAHCREPKPTPEDVHESILKERQKFEETCLKKVLMSAKAGDVNAIDWLSQRGLFDSIKAK